MKIVSVADRHSNFMKIAPFVMAIKNFNRQSVAGYRMPVKNTLVNTELYDDLQKLESFLKEINLPHPGAKIEFDSGSHTGQTGYSMLVFEKMLITEKPDWIVVVGDSNAASACSATAKKMNIMVCHIRAGLSPGDITLPKQSNRIITESDSELLFTTDRVSLDQLLSEGIDKTKIRFVGNFIIDLLELHRIRESELIPDDIVNQNLVDGTFISRLSLKDEHYSVMALHLIFNIDNSELLGSFLDSLLHEVSSEHPLIWLVHQRTIKQLVLMGYMKKISKNNGVFLLEQSGYNEMLRLNMGARVMLTDSEAMREECCVLGRPCITLRLNTKCRAPLCENGGTCVIVGKDIDRIKEEYLNSILMDKKPFRPEMWDVKSAERCLEAIMNLE